MRHRRQNNQNDNGPYYAINNDASILIDVLESDCSLRELLRPGDIVLLDRGFRDVKRVLEKKYMLQVEMPSCNLILLIYK